MISTNSMIIQKNDLQKQIDKIQDMIRNMPQDNLICRRQNGVFRYCYLKTEIVNGRTIEKECYLSGNDPLLRQLVKRDYYKRQLKDLYRELKATDGYLRWHQDDSEVSRYLDRHPGVREMLPKALIDETNKYYEWANAEYARNLSHPEHLIFITDGGFYVRSKSEQMIANMLLAEGIPLRYEDPVWTPEGNLIYPDFHIYSLRNYREWYLEHHGMMLKQEYFDHFMWKLDQLRRAGIIPGVNLLQTFEAEGYPLEPDCIRELIRLYLK